MQELIAQLYEIIRDYRINEGDPSVEMSPDRIKRWILQFHEDDRAFILEELIHVFKQVYCSRENALDFLRESITHLQKQYNYSTPEEFLKETVFLDLQNANKSQHVLLTLLETILQQEYNFDIANCGASKKKNYVYIDDILCTGNTLYQNISAWAKTKDEDGNTYLENIENDEIRLIFLYIFIHSSNYKKKMWQFHYQLLDDFDSYCDMSMVKEIQNEEGSNLEILLPQALDQPLAVEEYRQKVEAEVDKACEEKAIQKAEPHFYRPTGAPSQENFFSSPESRRRLENIFLQKGIEILEHAQVNKKNMRALGYSLPTHKNFGFGTLCLTWRNIPNNTPLVLWYAGGGFFPLFVKNHT